MLQTVTFDLSYWVKLWKLTAYHKIIQNFENKGRIFTHSPNYIYANFRDCKKFDPVKRAKEIFNALDLNNDGAITEDEFVLGCKSDSCFMKVIDEMSLDFLEQKKLFLRIDHKHFCIDIL